MKQTVVIGISSGIAAYKISELVKDLRKQGVDVKIVMTPHAAHMVSPQDLEKDSGNPVMTDLYPPGFNYQKVLKDRSVDHIDLADSANVFVIAPATANVIAKLAHGIADDVLTTTALAVTAPSIICASMNVHMWNNPATQENISLLRKRGFIIIEPDEGPLACGYNGKGRLAPISVIAEEIKKQLAKTASLKGKHILVTTGGTIEPLDDVRSIVNKSTGKMGIAIAEACYLRGASVTVLRAEHSVPPKYVMTEKTFTTASDLFEKISNELPHIDIMFHVAAVSDFTAEKNTGKLDSQNVHSVTLTPRQKILDHIKKINPKVTLVAFKAEFDLSEKDLIKAAEKRLMASQADAIIANDIGKPGHGFQSDTNEVIVITQEKAPVKISLRSKSAIAEAILDTLTAQFS